MAFDLTGLTLQAKQCPDFSKFIAEKTFGRPDLKSVHKVFEGIKTDEFIVLASQLGLSGLKQTGCTPAMSGAKSVLSQKKWEPVTITDTIVTCIASQSQNFQAYRDKIESAKQIFNGEASDEMAFLAVLVLETIQALVWRATWYADKDVAEATSVLPGLIPASPDETGFWNYNNGLWKQAFSAVSGGILKRVTIGENTPSGSPLEIGTMTAEKAKEYLDAVYKTADHRLKKDLEANFLVTSDIFEGYCDYLTGKSINYTVEYTQEGFKSVKYKGHNVIDMAGVFDVNNEHFVNNTTDNLAYLPHRIFFSAPANIPVGTINEGDLSEIESWYNKDEMTNKTRYIISIDAKLLDENLAVVAY